MSYSSFLKIIFYLPTVILVSLYYFPMGVGVGSLSTKTLLAVVGLFILIFNLPKIGDASISRDLIKLSITACAVSFICFFSVTIHHTQDFTYATYIISMWVWLAAAYTVIYTIKYIYGRIDVVILCDLLMVACIIQCASAIMIDQIPAVHDFASRFQDTEWIESVDRLYGISTALDTAGIHFAVVLFMITYILANKSKNFTAAKIIFYWISFIIITVIGNMMARTTIVGTGLGLLYILWKSGGQILRDSNQRRIIKHLAFSVLILLPIVIFYYRTNTRIYDNIRFGFEGFFSLVEKGEWDVASNNTLKRMIVFPESLETWMIGDGYLENPKSDPYYIGPITEGYYMNTDIGYARFIFYFGTLGLIAFSAFIIQAGIICASFLPKYRAMCIGLILLNFIIWLKVSTDIFFIFALLYNLSLLKSPNDNSAEAAPGLIAQ